MKRLVLVLVACAGCGDNSRTCGEGTMAVDGVCVPASNTMCGEGTVLDMTTGTCVVAPGTCVPPEVLIGDKCQDPSAGLTIDLEEGPEPNNLGIANIEPTNNAAGSITDLKAIGEPYVIHGHITPQFDNNNDGQLDPDLDAFVLKANGPTLLEISVDGVHGLDGAFYMIADPQGPVPAFERYGLTLTNDTSKRQIFLPAAGLYVLVIGDTRSMYIGTNPPLPAGLGGAAGGPDAEYYASLTVLAMPQATPLTPASGVATASGTLGPDEIKFFTMPMGDGINNVVNDMPGQAAAGSVIVMKNSTAFKGYSDEVDGSFVTIPADAAVAGFQTADQALIAVDAAYNYGPTPEPFTLTVTTASAVALCPASGPCTNHVATETEVSNSPDTTLDKLNAYYYDVAADDEVDGIQIAWNHPIDAMIVDDNLFIVARFTGFSGNTWGSYKGLVRHRRAGRYYVVGYDPNGSPGLALTATTTMAVVTPPAITEGTPLTGQAVTKFNANAFTYDAGMLDAWQQFSVTGSGTGAVTAQFYNPTTAYGRLDAVPGCTGCAADVTPIFTDTFAAATPQGRVLLDDGTTQYFVKTNTGTGTGTFALDFRVRAGVTDLGSIAAGGSAMASNQMLSGTQTKSFYLVRTDLGNPVTVTTTPVTTTLNTQFHRLNADESQLGANVNNGVPGAADSATFLQSGTTWTAFVVSSVTPLAAAATYNVRVDANHPVSYGVTNGTTAFADACGAGSLQLVFTPNSDDGLTTAIPAPAGFQFFGETETQLIVSSNGFLSFGPLTESLPDNGDLPDAALPNSLVAPYWDDLVITKACRKTVGSKLIIQWVGTTYNEGAAVQFQVILDGAAKTIEFVYAAAQVATGGGATIGLEDPSGSHAAKLGFNMANTIAPGSSKLFTPQ